MAGDRPPRLQRPRNRTLVLAAVAFLLSIIFLQYIHLGPAPLNLSSRPVPGEPEPLRMDDKMAATTKRTYPQILDLPASLLPTAPSTPRDTPRRLIIVGDVHGHLKSLEALLRKAEFSKSRGDTVVLAGDMVNKGPDSPGVVDLAMRIGAYGVRGNHEDRVLTAWQHYERRGGKAASTGSDTDDEGEEIDATEIGIANININAEDSEDESDNTQSSSDIEAISKDEEGISKNKNENKKGKKKGKKGKGKGKKKSKDRKPRRSDLGTAQSLKPSHRAWLSSLPLILRIGDLGPRYGEVLVVHAGLVPGIPLESQDPDAVMTMRTLLPYSERAADSRPDTNTPNAGQTPLIADPAADAKPGHGHKPMVPSAEHDGVPWAEIWTTYQTSLATSHGGSSRPSTVVYGHDAKAGLRMRRYAFGLDSGCARDHALTGVVFEFASAAAHSSQEDAAEDGEVAQEEEEGWNTDGEVPREQRTRARIRHRLVSVSCAEA
ncbi:Metallo-dependent phosphatase [Hypoxylon argillaceum]|nr:Metallo-dependent phosphatase [Hypoxylon argillaceum]